MVKQILLNTYHELLLYNQNYLICNNFVEAPGNYSELKETIQKIIYCIISFI